MGGGHGEMNVNGSVTLSEMRFHAMHGVMPQERKVGNEFVVSLRVDYPMDKAMQSDALDDALDYSAVYAIVYREMEKPSKLLENVAGRIISALHAEFPQITSGEISIGKIAPPFKSELSSANVSVKFSF
ncbi:MAG: dihydroneopterin aldolase [Muribaculaceae bacterium]|jgi:dihydroneopterin aldolase|nr:dihydroneopterin aldolase [Muribaculaceae bacterium]